MIELDKLQAEQLVNFIVGHHDRIPRGIQLTAEHDSDRQSIRVEGLGKDGAVTDTAVLYARKERKAP
ncbi:MAG: hypothetical protein WBM00_11780 [Solirubrobacterales bacterium]